jgi:glycerol uptake facilitator-like aquaporin
VPLTGGIALAITVASLGHVSGAHLNPAVTIGLALNRRFPWTIVPAYIAAQCAGAVGGALVAWAIFGDRGPAIADLGATFPASGVTAGRAFVAEAVATFLLVIVIMSVAPPGPSPRYGPEEKTGASGLGAASCGGIGAGRR